MTAVDRRVPRMAVAEFAAQTFLCRSPVSAVGTGVLLPALLTFGAGV